MKTRIKISILFVILSTILSCTSKEKKAVDYTGSAELAAAKPTLTLAEKRSNNEKRRIAQEERRRLDFQARVKITPFYTDVENNTIYNRAETDPTFVGGEKALAKYLNENIKYPAQAEADELEGTVFVDFIVGASGKVRDIVVSDMPGEEADQSLRDEAIRVVSNMPKWTAGRQHGKPVDVAFSLPITFRMM
jgi:TonB family protein